MQKPYISQAYTYKRRILIQVLPVPNAYTKSANAYINFLSFFFTTVYQIFAVVKNIHKTSFCITWLLYE